MNEDLILHMIGAFPEIPGKKVFQKMAYFLQEAEGAKLGVRFRMKRFGPFSAELEYGLQELAERRLVNISGSNDEGFRISYSEEAPRTLPDLEPHDAAALEEVKEKLSQYLSMGLRLELLASLHFLTKDHYYTGTQADREWLVAQLQAWKGKKFDPGIIEEQIDRLEELGYLLSSA